MNNEIFPYSMQELKKSQGLDYSKQELSGRVMLIHAKNDLEAVSSWLSQHEKSKNTFLLYQREAKRFLLWCSYVRGKYFSELKVSDLDEYLNFLASPPKELIATKAQIRKKSSLDVWRPFCGGGLKGSSFNSSVRAVKSLFSFLSDANYISGNPFKLLKSHTKFSLEQAGAKIAIKKRMLSGEEWQSFLASLNEMPDNSYYEKNIKLKTQLIVGMLYFLGLRLSELQNSAWNSIYLDDGKYWFSVVGKGGKPATIPLNENLLSLIKNYRVHMGLEILPNIHDTAKIIQTNSKPLSLSSMYKYIKKVAHKAAGSFPVNSASNIKLKQMSPHWLRHLSASHQDALGVPPTVIKENHRHGSFLTTQIYLHAEDDLRHQEIQKLSASITIDANDAMDYTVLKISILNYHGNELAAENFIKVLEKYIMPQGSIQKKEVISKAITYDTDYYLNGDLDVDVDMIEFEAECRLLKVKNSFICSAEKNI